MPIAEWFYTFVHIACIRTSPAYTRTAHVPRAHLCMRCIELYEWLDVNNDIDGLTTIWTRVVFPIFSSNRFPNFVHCPLKSNRITNIKRSNTVFHHLIFTIPQLAHNNAPAETNASNVWGHILCAVQSSVCGVCRILCIHEDVRTLFPIVIM